MDYVKSLLKNLDHLIECGNLTKGRVVDNDTIVCFTEKLATGEGVYSQISFEMLSPELQNLFKGLSIGDKVQNLKVVGVWDCWHQNDRLVSLRKNVLYSI